MAPFGGCVGVTNMGKSGFGKASDRVQAKKHSPYGILSGCVVVPSQQKGKSSTVVRRSSSGSQSLSQAL